MVRFHQGMLAHQKISIFPQIKMNMNLDGDLKSHQLLITHFMLINSAHLQKI